MSDPMVLAAQQWLNSTYQNVAGYSPCVEDGETGNQTIGCIIMGLQDEMGISPVVANLGPTTWADMQAYGTISATHTTLNRTKLLQCALYCKGYDGDGISGDWDDGRTAEGLRTIQQDIGYSATSSTGAADPKLLRALLNTDAFVLVSGGAPTVRAAQQWLNMTYISRENFFYCPCDGLFSRNVQVAVVYGIQYELGQSDAEADGQYGMGTASELQSDPSAVIQVGDADGAQNWVHLFKAVMMFNSLAGAFSGTFSSADSVTISTFQQSEGFAPPEQTGIGDYRTWAELLVSTGDPSRTATGADMASTITAARAQALFDAGYRTVGRYLTNYQLPGALDKKIKSGELNTIFSHGLSVFPIFEEGGDDANWFSYAQGVADAVRADQAARSYGFKAEVVIYFAVDFDATDIEITNLVLPYFRGVRDGLSGVGSRYSAGVYGTRNLCTRVGEAGLSAKSFVAGMSTGWSGNLGFRLPADWAFNQIEGLTVDAGGTGEVEIDKDVSSGRDQGQDSTDSNPSEQDPNADYFVFLAWLENAAESFSNANPGSESPAILVCQYMRGSTYTGWNWDLFLGPINTDFIVYVGTQADVDGITPVTSYLEPSIGGPQGEWSVDHFFASLNGYLVNPWPLDPDEPVLADLGGWAGDLVTVLADYVDANTNQGTYDFGIDQIGGVQNINNSMDIQDLTQDVDAFNVAHSYLTTSGTRITDWVRATYGDIDGTYATRFTTYYQARFGGSSVSAKSCAEQVFLLPADTTQHITFRTGVESLLIHYHPVSVIHVSDFTDQQLRGLGDAFVHVVQNKVDLE